MHALVYVFRTKDREELKFDEAKFDMDVCYSGEDSDCIYPLMDWCQLGGRFRGTIPLKQEHLHRRRENLGNPSFFENEPRLPNGVDYAQYEWIDFDSWDTLPFIIIVDNKVVMHPYANEHKDKDRDMKTNETKSIMSELREKGFFDVIALDIHF